jgi:hypothetical protein
MKLEDVKAPIFNFDEELEIYRVRIDFCNNKTHTFLAGFDEYVNLEKKILEGENFTINFSQTEHFTINSNFVQSCLFNRLDPTRDAKHFLNDGIRYDIEHYGYAIIPELDI